MTEYTVLVDFHCGLDEDEVAHLFSHCDFVEDIGRSQWQVGMGVVATNEGEAYRLAANTVESLLATRQSDTAIFSATAYDGDEKDGVTFD